MSYLTPSLSALAPYCKKGKHDIAALERELAVEIKQRTKGREHYVELLESLPAIRATSAQFNQSVVTIGSPADISSSQHQQIMESLTKLIPWRKGPFNLMGVELDAEWRSDVKWDRIDQVLGDLSGKLVLDIGCGNGYYMFRMLAKNPELVLGIDPVWHCHAQFHLINHFAPINQLHHHQMGIDHLPMMGQLFDTILSMGIIYHHRHPIQQLTDIYQALRPKGELILESIGIPGETPHALFPPDRYAQMSNVWFIPTISCMINWLKKSKFKEIEVLADTPLTPQEQRLTRWCPPPHRSLSDFLDPNDPTRTVEGFDAPRRFAIYARRK
ncbi:MAG: tRNA 5-methoxyuridine(34)/uridine 5-oxyacetic acid(34) synthase CmoB [Bdellovibrionales bacterium]|nr:tRNA 5-methoxyuridine(34)/uridine 5-oxyacetic acid(34) synthase CmoB [Bdellovibrionales bacterium]MBT3525190.1 tRNA 5-methoxyuridine(34)/uridine 5-oxyacetic acid(34) synthase CmoB [Bdellovibrionales bacterium]MBT7668677.1 tRNA 5-methoxyuridine(34)/uridine 5-oxyacetic acid(34) synthase CmoB [Bdellovibrionales bacterium]MBT7766553.1 tRNA 5-methoxyuridine(34)/uridine 5-oxyacetic acid(34) synthase CmoB [Bdellovibrionales bacterium]